MAISFHIRANQVIAAHYTDKKAPSAENSCVAAIPKSSEAAAVQKNIEPLGSTGSREDISMKKRRVPRGLKFYMTEQSYITSELLMWDK